MRVFRNGEGRVRSGWRVLGWLVAVATALAGAHVVRSLAGVRPREGFGLSPELALSAGLSVLAIALVSLAAWRVFDSRRPGATPLAPSAPARRSFALGLAAGLAAVALVVGALSAAGAYRVEPRACAIADQAAFAAGWLGILALAAAAEELLFRGYALFTLHEGVGRTGAVALMAALFGLAHAGNPHFGWAAGLSIAFIGALLGWWALSTGTLWGVFGVHLGWNWALAAGAAMPVSGLDFSAPCYEGALTGPAWLTGGAFGVEGGVAAVTVWALGGGAYWARRRAARGPAGADRALPPR